MSHTQHRATLALLFAGGLLAAATACAAPAHHHGQARLEGVQEGAMLQLELTSPLDALVGFERAPRNDAERSALAAMSDTLRDAGKMLSLPKEAGCHLQNVALESPVIEGGHADITAQYRFSCSQPDRLRELRVGFFASFPRLHKIELRFAGQSGQRAATLTAKTPRFAW